MKFLLTFITFSSGFALSLSSKSLKSIETNDSENSPQVIDEVVIQSIDGNLMSDILDEYNRYPKESDTEKQLSGLFGELAKSQEKLNRQFLSVLESDRFQDVLLKPLMSGMKEVFKLIWNNFLLVLDEIWVFIDEGFHQIFSRRLPYTYYLSAKLLAKQSGSYLCQKAMSSMPFVSAEKARHQCSTIMSSFDI